GVIFSPIMRPPSYRQRLFVEYDLGESSRSATLAARRAGYPWPEQMARKMLRNVEKTRSSSSQKRSEPAALRGQLHCPARRVVFAAGNGGHPLGSSPSGCDNEGDQSTTEEGAMSTASVTMPTLLTAEEFAQRPDPEYPEELVRGRIVPLPMPKPRHGEICNRVGRILGDCAENRDLGRVLSNDTGIITERGPDTVRGADISF